MQAERGVADPSIEDSPVVSGEVKPATCCCRTLAVFSEAAHTVALYDGASKA